MSADDDLDQNASVAHESLQMQKVEERAKSNLVKPKLNLTERLRAFLQNPYVLVLLFLLVLWDIALLIYSEVEYSGDSAPNWVAICSWIIISIFLGEVVLRIIAFRKAFFFNIIDVLDGIVVITSFVLLAVGEGAGAKSVAVIRILRAIRLIRVLKMCCRMYKDLQGGARRITGENKKRFNSVKDGFDLDLTYIVGDDEDGIPEPNRLIAMSVPAIGCQHYFRNPIDEVVRFFHTYHPEKFKIYNACPELPYPSEPFGGDDFVRPFDIQDHTPPRMKDFVDFLADGWELMQRDPENVVVAHCRGGKGRTGSLCCAWLLFSQKKVDSENGPKVCDGTDSLVYFANARSDLSQSTKLQGVDTPSQKRYVVCLDRLLRHNNSYLSTPKEALKPPPDTVITLKSLACIDFFAKAPEGNLVVVVEQAGDGGGLDWKELVVSAALPGSAAVRDPFDLQGVKAQGDIKISVYNKDTRDQAMLKEQASGKKEPKRYIAGKEPGMLFYFIIHTAFLNIKTGTKQIGTDMMDKAFKDKKEKKYKQHNADHRGRGLVKLTFEADANEPSLGDPFTEDGSVQIHKEADVGAVPQVHVVPPTKLEDAPEKPKTCYL